MYLLYKNMATKETRIPPRNEATATRPKIKTSEKKKF